MKIHSRRMLKCLIPIVGFVCLTSSVSAQVPLIESLFGKGVRIATGQVVDVPKPTIHPDRTEQEIEAALKQLPGSAGWARFVRDSATAPISTDFDYIKDDEGTKLGHKIHVAFVVHASLKKLVDKDLMEQLFAGSKKETDQDTANNEKPEHVSGNELSRQELKLNGITQADGSRYFRLQLPLLDKILAKGIMQVQQHNNDESLQIAFRLDDRWPDLQNAWTRMNEQDDKMVPDESGWQAYQGVGGYLVVNELPNVDGACLVEARIVMHEPTEWFKRSTALRAKLPLMIQESVRSFRRKLKR